MYYQLRIGVPLKCTFHMFHYFQKMECCGESILITFQLRQGGFYVTIIK